MSETEIAKKKVKKVQPGRAIASQLTKPEEPYMFGNIEAFQMYKVLPLAIMLTIFLARSFLGKLDLSMTHNKGVEPRDGDSVRQLCQDNWKILTNFFDTCPENFATDIFPFFLSYPLSV